MRLLPYAAALFAILMFGFAPVAAGPFEDAVVAYRVGDYANALRLLRPLADQDLADAQNLLGSMYAVGAGVSQDHTEAAKWYLKAAEQGQARAQYSLGVAYINGEGVPKDFVLAHMWLNLSAAQGLNFAARTRDLLSSERMTLAQIAEAQKLAREWTPILGH
jgi:TPR repeat protein